MIIRTFEADRDALLPLFRLADDSESEISSYYRLGDVLVALDQDEIVGMALVEEDAGTVQISALPSSPLGKGKGSAAG